MTSDNFVELVRMNDPVSADLFAAFLDDAELEYAVTDPGSAGIGGSMTPQTQTQIIFRVAEEDMPYAEELLDEYRRMQAGPLLPSEAPPPADKGEGGKTE
ncbi:MAG: DUF2007 domain-containing protein [Proteobacteria bacterium]|jgi:hypothetical protein|nr:DUF2007 domain-containing protein [Pseudomonadota bacterium]